MILLLSIYISGLFAFFGIIGVFLANPKCNDDDFSDVKTILAGFLWPITLFLFLSVATGYHVGKLCQKITK